MEPENRNELENNEYLDEEVNILNNFFKRIIIIIILSLIAKEMTKKMTKIMSKNMENRI